MVVLGWSYGCLKVGLGLGFGWPYGVPGFYKLKLDLKLILATFGVDFL